MGPRLAGTGTTVLNLNGSRPHPRGLCKTEEMCIEMRLANHPCHFRFLFCWAEVAYTLKSISETGRSQESSVPIPKCTTVNTGGFLAYNH